jgi:hypothetical protein
MGNIDPEAERWDDNYNGSESNSEYLKRLWDTALEAEPNPLPIPRPASPQQAPQGFSQADPRATISSSYSDEPPF